MIGASQVCNVRQVVRAMTGMIHSSGVLANQYNKTKIKAFRKDFKIDINLNHITFLPSVHGCIYQLNSLGQFRRTFSREKTQVDK